ncbi:MAG: class I SAM-dependent methyltransferase [Vicinamibacterales bacterium]|nr:class I SAM-dependent methyltransferase [Vicinamibacterales bacterium]
MILPTIVKMLLQEHAHRPIRGRVLCLGPQQVALHKGEVDAMFAATPQEAAEAMEAWRRDGADTSVVTDAYFFSKFPKVRLDSLDVVEGFGGTVIHDLNKPIHHSLEGRYDFILDGGTFDHLVQLGTAFQNVIRLLKPGGRVLHYNAASGYIGAAYVSFGPDLFYDFYVVNKFADCRIHILRGTGPGTHAPFEVFYLPDARTKRLNSARNQMVACLAEKAEDSTFDAVPVEYTYRPPVMREEYSAIRAKMLRSKRPMLQGNRPLWPTVRETLRRTRAELAWARDRYRAGKFTWDKFRANRARHKAGTGYIYIGQL